MKRIEVLQAQFCDEVCHALNDVLTANITEHEFVQIVTTLRERLIHDCNERLTELASRICKGGD